MSSCTDVQYLDGTRRAGLRRRFAGKPWLDVFSKADLLEEEFDAANDLLAARLDDAASAVAASSRSATSSRHASSVPTPDPGRTPAEVAHPLDGVMCGNLSGDTGEIAAHVSEAGKSLSQPATAVEVAAALQGAVQASSVTGAGLDPLKVGTRQG